MTRPESDAHSSQIFLEPVGREARDDLESSRLLEQVTRAGNDFHFAHGFHLVLRFLVHSDDWNVVAADDEECRSFHFRKLRARKVGTSAPPDDRPDSAGNPRCSDYTCAPPPARS